jgi:hypothetical protein
MPRRYKADPRTYFKTFRFTAAELTRLESRARARRQGLSAFVRAVLFSGNDGEELNTHVTAPRQGRGTNPAIPGPPEPPSIKGRLRSSRQGISTYVRAVLFGAQASAGGTPSRTKPRGAQTGEASEDYPIAASRRTSADRLLIDQLRRVGTNLNQIAHRMNERRIPPPRELTMTLDEIRDIVRRAREL